MAQGSTLQGSPPCDGRAFDSRASSGEDFDNRLIKHLLTLAKKVFPDTDPSKSPAGMQKLRREAERAKRALSTNVEVRVEIEGLIAGVDFSELVTRAKFEELCADLFRQTLVPVEKVRVIGGVIRKFRGNLRIRYTIDAGRFWLLSLTEESFDAELR